jgi:hypothetical protein
MRVTNIPSDNGQGIPGQNAAGQNAAGQNAAGQMGRRRFLATGGAAATLIGAPSARSLIGAPTRRAGRWADPRNGHQSGGHRVVDRAVQPGAGLDSRGHAAHRQRAAVLLAKKYGRQ